MCVSITSELHRRRDYERNEYTRSSVMPCSWSTLTLSMLVAFACLAEEHPPGAPTYYGDAGRILSRHRVGCHREGQPGRIPLDTWRQARLFAKEIRLVVGMRMMPPWPAVPEFGHFSNDRSLSIADVETLIRWTDTGAKRALEKGISFQQLSINAAMTVRLRLDIPRPIECLRLETWNRAASPFQPASYPRYMDPGYRRHSWILR